jgi:hypothetical protein
MNGRTVLALNESPLIHIRNAARRLAFWQLSRTILMGTMRAMHIDLKERRSKREREGDTTICMKKNRTNSNNDHTKNVIAQSLNHITNHIIEQTKTSKSLVEIKELCIFLVVKYSVADIDIPSRLSPSISVDNTWHWLLLFPSVYASTCQRAYDLAAIITENDFAYSAFPRIVDHNPNAANDL